MIEELKARKKLLLTDIVKWEALEIQLKIQIRAARKEITSMEGGIVELNKIIEKLEDE